MSAAWDAHRITYFRRRGSRYRKHGWRCSCGVWGRARSSAKAQRTVALHLWLTGLDFDPFGGDDAREAWPEVDGRPTLMGVGYVVEEVQE